MASAGNLKKGFVMFYRTAGNASFRLSEPRVTHGTPTDTQNEMRACNSCGSPVPAEAAWQKQCKQRPLPAEGLHKPAADKDRSLLRGVNYPGIDVRAFPRIVAFASAPSKRLTLGLLL